MFMKLKTLSTVWQVHQLGLAHCCPHSPQQPQWAFLLLEQGLILGLNNPTLWLRISPPASLSLILIPLVNMRNIASLGRLSLIQELEDPPAGGTQL